MRWYSVCEHQNHRSNGQRRQINKTDYALFDWELSSFPKYASWEWHTLSYFNLNISFTHFSLVYSGEFCTNERVVINTTEIIGQFCGRRYPWSMFAKFTKLEFFTYFVSKSTFQLHFQISHKIFTNSPMSEEILQRELPFDHRRQHFVMYTQHDIYRMIGEFLHQR